MSETDTIRGSFCGCDPSEVEQKLLDQLSERLQAAEFRRADSDGGYELIHRYEFLPTRGVEK